ncbi:lipopolysaccharide biosynthesis protein [Pseudarthrobacter sp. NBSH8]|uniref:lipopolysaccharide biosynthesis protein n=1 Tax=Pseudarthrobacter sp. NBSH8 TaxID=2596911 RepID=UPI001625E3F5|nr:oligosaccharide flippase family protein [Pseudarthrobacter sp. NBSH8]
MLWSFIERIMPRAATALLMFLAAIYVSPSILGIYTWAILGFTLLQSVFDVAVRQVAVGALRTRSGLRFLVNYRTTFMVVGVLIIGVVIVSLLLTQPNHLHSSIWMLCPLAVAPIAMASGTKSVATLQSAGKWKALASAQSLSVLISLIISLPVVLMTRSIAGCVLQVSIVELIFAFMVVRMAKATQIPASQYLGIPPASVVSQFSSASTYSALGWGQGQADRVLVGLLVGTAKLGQYNLAWSVSRSLGDAIVNASVNVIRPQILDKANDVDSQGDVRRLLSRACLMITVTIVLTIAGTEFILKPVLGDEWADALRAVPVMALCTYPQIFSYTATIYLTRLGKLRAGLLPKILGLLLAIPIALAAVSGLTFAAWLAVARELVVMIWLVWLVRKQIPLLGMVIGASGFGVMASFVLVWNV